MHAYLGHAWAAKELARIIKDGEDNIVSDPEAARDFLKAFNNQYLAPEISLRQLNETYFSKNREIEYVQPETFKQYDEDSIKSLIEVATTYNSYLTYYQYGHFLMNPPFMVRYAIETLINQNNIKYHRLGLLLRAFHKYHPDFFIKLKLVPVYVKDLDGAFLDILEIIKDNDIGRPIHIGEYFVATGFDDNKAMSPYSSYKIVIGEILHDHNDSRAYDYLSDEEFKELKIKTRMNITDKQVRLIFKGDGVFYQDTVIEGDDQWHSFANLSFKIRKEDDQYRIDIKNTVYRNSSFEKDIKKQKPNFKDDQMEVKTLLYFLELNHKEQIPLFCPKHERLKGFVNYYCLCNIKVEEDKR